MRQAVDIALLPRVRDAVPLIALNEELIDRRDDEIRLAQIPGRGRGLPHLSLLMGVLEPEAVGAVGDALAAIAHASAVIHATARGLEAEGATAGVATIALALDASPELLALRKTVIETIAPLLHADARRDDLLEAEDGDAERALTYIRGYLERAEQGEFRPHITIGRGEKPTGPAPEALVFDRLGLYGLGPGCTCRREIFGIDLR
ncbi:MAG: 2'-5' RNA ligase family protein [Planctomycetes bacterium]|nr:2'-5' RNA ligase family protein [Planctomycetota bacterium]